jgi:hypothetical protein
MSHLHNFKEGDWVSVEVEGEMKEGVVDQLDVDKAGVDTGDGSIFWYEPHEIQPIPLTEDWLFRFGFERSDRPELNGEGQAYTHGPFVFHYLKKDNDQLLLLTCHGEQDRHFEHGLKVHELQHHYHEMTKVFLE